MNLIGTTVKMFGVVKIGDGCLIEDGVVLGHPSAAEVRAAGDISHFPSIDEFYHAATKAVTEIGDGVQIRSGTVIYSGCVLGGKIDCGHNVLIRENVRIGNNTYVKPYTEIMKNVQIGSNCRLAGTISDNTIIEDFASSFGILTHRYEKYYSPEMSQQKGPILREGAIVGRGAVVVGCVEIGAKAVVGANTFVNFNVPPEARVVGQKGTQR